MKKTNPIPEMKAIIRQTTAPQNNPDGPTQSLFLTLSKLSSPSLFRASSQLLTALRKYIPIRAPPTMVVMALVRQAPMANILDRLCVFVADRWFLSGPASGSALNGMLDIVESRR